MSTNTAMQTAQTTTQTKQSAINSQTSQALTNIELGLTIPTDLEFAKTLMSLKTLRVIQMPAFDMPILVFKSSELNIPDRGRFDATSEIIVHSGTQIVVKNINNKDNSSNNFDEFNDSYFIKSNSNMLEFKLEYIQRITNVIENYDEGYTDANGKPFANKITISFTTPIGFYRSTTWSTINKFINNRGVECIDNFGDASVVEYIDIELNEHALVRSVNTYRIVNDRIVYDENRGNVQEVNNVDIDVRYPTKCYAWDDGSKSQEEYYTLGLVHRICGPAIIDYDTDGKNPKYKYVHQGIAYDPKTTVLDKFKTKFVNPVKFYVSEILAELIDGDKTIYPGNIRDFDLNHVLIPEPKNKKSIQLMATMNSGVMKIQSVYVKNTETTLRNGNQILIERYVGKWKPIEGVLPTYNLNYAINIVEDQPSQIIVFEPNTMRSEVFTIENMGEILNTTYGYRKTSATEYLAHLIVEYLPKGIQNPKPMVLELKTYGNGVIKSIETYQPDPSNGHPLSVDGKLYHEVKPNKHMTTLYKEIKDQPLLLPAKIEFKANGVVSKRYAAQKNSLVEITSDII